MGATTPIQSTDPLTVGNRYFFEFSNPKPVLIAAAQHPGWQAQVEDRIAAQTGYSVKVIGGGETYDVVNGATENLFGVMVDVTAGPSGAPTNGVVYQTDLQPAQIGAIVLGIGLVASAIAAVLVVDTLSQDLVRVLKVNSGSSFSGIVQALKVAGLAALVFAFAAVTHSMRRAHAQ